MWSALLVLCCSAALSGRAGGTEPASPRPWWSAEAFREGGRRAPPAIAQAPEVVSGIQIHGNTATPDEEIRRLAGIEIGTPIQPTTVDEVAARLRATNRFRSVQVLKRYASIADLSQILIVVIVDEGAVKVERTGNPDRPTRIVRSRPLNLMFLPILTREDGYGFTYGARFARVGLLGKDSRISFPLTWGGEKKAAAELDKTFSRAPIDRLLAGVSISRRTNPFFDLDDDRRRVWVRGEREIAPTVRLGATGGLQQASFPGAGEDLFTQLGADVVLDTRLDPVLARNAVYARVAWEHLAFQDGPAHDGPFPSANRVELDARGYVGLMRQNILVLRALRHDSNDPLPPYLKPLLGGMANLRGFKAGDDIGDTLVSTSAELIVPLTSPLKVGKLGVSVFVDAGTVYDKGERLSDQTLKQGYGGSVWLSAAFVRLNVAVAHGRGSSTRAHVGFSLSF
jgi:outer membrane protein assembly factor BamA